MINPYEIIDARLRNIEVILLDIKHKPKEPENKLHSVKTLAEFAEVSELTIRNWIKDGKIIAKRIPGKRPLFIDEEQFKSGLQEVKSLRYKR